jgi:adenosine deaminase
MSQEVNKLVETFSFTQEEILQITKKTIEAGFVNSKKRAELLSTF